MPRYPSRYRPAVIFDAPRGASIPSYPDRGCEFSPSCLECALPQCVHDMARGDVIELRRREKSTL